LMFRVSNKLDLNQETRFTILLTKELLELIYWKVVRNHNESDNDVTLSLLPNQLSAQSGATTLSITTHNIMALSIKGLQVTLSNNDT